jgi:polyhydroxyalkanoate synthase
MVKGSHRGFRWSKLNIGDVEEPEDVQNEAHDRIRKLVKASGLLMNPPKVEVGTTPSKVVHEDGKMRLLHYLPIASRPHRIPLLIVYALVNKPYILDLQPDRSVVRRFLNAGFEVYLIDWGTPSEGDKFFNLDDYVNWYMDDVIELIKHRHDVESISILGYCMGGTLSAMYAALNPDKVRNLMLMAAPLDFEADRGLLRQWSRDAYFDVDLLVDASGNIPGEFLNSGFLLLDPVKNLYSKYMGFVENVDDDEFVKLFFRMEKWIHDGIPVAGEAYREFIKHCYQQNLLVKSQLEYDHLVTPESSMSFNDLVPSSDKKLMVFPTGHIGLSVSSTSHTEFWPRVISWLKSRSGGMDEGIQDSDESLKKHGAKIQRNKKGIQRTGKEKTKKRPMRKKTKRTTRKKVKRTVRRKATRTRKKGKR